MEFPVKRSRHTPELDDDLTYDLTLVTYEMVRGWAGPGLTPPIPGLYPQLKTFFHSLSDYFTMKVPTHFTGECFKQQIEGISNIQVRTWGFSPGICNWDFKELPSHESLANCTALKNKAIYIETHRNCPVFEKSSAGWVFARKLPELHCFPQESSPVLVFFKWFQERQLKVMGSGTIRGQSGTQAIREKLYKLTGIGTENMVLHLEKCRSSTASPHLIPCVFTLAPNENYSIPLNNVAPLGLKHLQVSSGDIFIGELETEQPTAKNYIFSISNLVLIKCKLYEPGEFSEDLTLRMDLLFRQIDVMKMISEHLCAQNRDVPVENVQIYMRRSTFRGFRALPLPEAQDGFPTRRKSRLNPPLTCILDENYNLYYSIRTPPFRGLS